jgi:glycosyltransferase involved in cell wall biosynthesis
LASALQTALDDPDRSGLDDVGRELIEEYDWDRITSATERVYRRVIDSRRS